MTDRLNRTCPDCDGDITDLPLRNGAFTACPHCDTPLTARDDAPRNRPVCDTPDVISPVIRALALEAWYAQQLRDWAEYRSKRLFMGLTLKPVEKLEIQRLQGLLAELQEQRGVR